jgi:large subunit ribosomal protein L35
MAGYKMKSHKGAAKRFRITGGGKVKRGRTSGSHLLSHKSATRMRHIKSTAYCNSTDEKMIKKLLPYG